VTNLADAVFASILILRSSREGRRIIDAGIGFDRDDLRAATDRARKRR
jgi:hypothetical protein